MREPVNRTSADLPHQLRDLLGNIEVGHLTHARDDGAGTADVRAVRKKRKSRRNRRLKRETREQIFSKRFEAESKKFLDEIRKSGDDRIQEQQMSERRALPLALTLGEPAGIGPDLDTCDLAAARELRLPPFYLIGDPDFSCTRARVARPRRADRDRHAGAGERRFRAARCRSCRSTSR